MQNPEVPNTLSFCVPLRIRWVDDDRQGVLNNAVYMTLFEEGRHAYFGELGLLDGPSFPFLLAQTNVLFLHPGHGACEVSLELGTTHLGTTSFTQAYRLRGPDGEIWVEAEARLVCHDGTSAVAMSPVFREKVRAFEAERGAAGL